MDKVLVIGGTNFIGRNLLEKMIMQSGFNITLFNRGRTNPDLFPQIRKITGDRYTEDISIIGKEEWDYVIDISCYHPHSLSSVLNIIGNKVKKYIFISTCSVYDRNLNKQGVRNEVAPVLDYDGEAWMENPAQIYGRRKAECERILLSKKIPCTIFRPALVYGEYDDTDRFYYWLYQVKKFEEILVPDHGSGLFSVTYVKDLAEAIIKAIDAEDYLNIYNVVTVSRLSIREIIECASGVLDKKPWLVNAPSAFLKLENIKPWTDLPLWLDSDLFTYDNTKLIREFGLYLAGFEQTIADTIIYYEKLGWPEPGYGIKEGTKRRLIEKVKKRRITTAGSS